MSADQNKPEHFKGKDAIGHVVEAQAQGIVSLSEIHGTEVPGHIAAAADAARESAVVVLLIWALLIYLQFSFNQIIIILSVFSLGWLVWKGGRSALLGWSRLERLHRIVAQEKWEIDHHRPQERAELTELYAAKGFEGKLLEDVIDVLMADDERLLRVMVDEELGLSLKSHEHPIKQGLGAFFGGLVSVLVCFLAYYIYPAAGMLFGALGMVAAAGAVLAHETQNKVVPSVIWNIGLGALSFGFIYFIAQYISF